MGSTQALARRRFWPATPPPIAAILTVSLASRFASP
jgi:hypothetical protein